MAHLSDFETSSRHDRLFELIRQDNIRQERRFRTPRSEQPTLTEMQVFLQRANRSLTPDGETQN